MKVCCLASGSKGNCTFVETEDVKFLIDCGLAIKDLEVRLNQIGESVSNINFVLVTHEHSDHVSGIAKLVNKYGITPYIYYKNLQVMKQKTKLPADKFVLFYQNDFFIGSTIITPFEISHDSNSCVAFKICSPSGKFVIITDTGYIDKGNFDFFNNSDLVIIESNHNVELLKNNSNYTLVLKKRILSNVGHLSNKQCATYIEEFIKRGCKQFVLAHLSENNNTPRVAVIDVTEHLLACDKIENKHYYLDLAWQSQVGTLYNICNNLKEYNQNQENK